MKKQLHIYYSGRVQGVGFRFTVESIALKLNLTGWVKNIADGRVEVLCEGEEMVLYKFLDAVKKSFVGGHIIDTEVTWSDATNKFDKFSIVF